MTARRQLKSAKVHRNYWFERLMAIIALINLLWVAFDLSYLPGRDFFRQQFPVVAEWYGKNLKGIQPHQDTETYLATVDRLKDQVAQTTLRSPETAELLSEMQRLSQGLLNENPFEAAGKTSTLEQIKRLMRDRTGEMSSHQAFDQFWSLDSLEATGWTESIAFFDGSIRPLIASNYYRNVGASGQLVDRFWQVDIWFVGVFAVEFLLRTLHLSRRYSGVNWLDAVLWRWYDLLLLLPFWRWLRVIPVTARLHQSRLVNFNPIWQRVTHGLIANFAIELTETVVLRAIGELQDAIEEGKVTRWFMQSQRRYIDLNDVNEIEAIIQQLVTVLVDRVLPKVQPDLEALVSHSVQRVLQQNPIYAGLERLPGVGQLPNQITRQIVADVSAAVYGGVATTLKDPQTEQLSHALWQNFSETFKAEVRQEPVLQALETLVTDLLEEVKVNYVDRISALDEEGAQAQNYQLYQMVQGSSRLLKPQD